MAQVIMAAAATVLGTAYALAALIRAYVGLVRKWARRAYWVSVPVCLALSAVQWWLLAIKPPPSALIIFGQTAALAAVGVIYIYPALIVLRSADRTE